MKRLCCILLLGAASVAWANVNIFLDSKAAPGTQQQFIENTLGQCTTTYFAPNTFPDSFDMILSSCAPINTASSNCVSVDTTTLFATMQLLVASETTNVNNLKTNVGNLKTNVGSLGTAVSTVSATAAFMVLNGTYSYSSGWSDGMSYDQFQQTNFLGTLIAPCLNSSTNTFTVAGSTSVYDTTISSQTCVDVVETIDNYLWQLISSTPTPPTQFPGDLKQETSE